ncbi:MAG: hypothetical protein DCF25_11840 [Leptolyngbya foveolarum]|uniref:Uncharacterized protein n=1 Tax=Leptolyngbya foveolarum TaxID=47253 RepID=A0A2W4UJ19_9CYAN|nr:MAG: hypothetical protein DCF25_11840 [Leptolyngbya foveolarum]
MPNPNPTQSEEFIKKRFQPAKDLPANVQLARKPRCVKLPQEVDTLISEMPKKERSVWIRQAICKAALEQGLVDEIK